MIEPIPISALIHTIIIVCEEISLLFRLIFLCLLLLMSSILLSVCYVLPPNPTIIVSKLQMVSVRLARTMCALAMTVLVGGTDASGWLMCRSSEWS